MTFAEFKKAYKEARERLRVLEGPHDFPGLSVHDRVYALPTDWQDEEYTAIVRAHSCHEHISNPVRVEVWHWHWRRGQEAKDADLDDRQLRAIADIKATVRKWITGDLDELPPSTCRHWGHRTQ